MFLYFAKKTMQALHFPPFEHQIKQKKQKPYIFDVVRRKYVLLTPEEWVRQHVLHWLLAKGYPKGLIRVEGMHQQYQLRKRTDVLIFDRQAAPLLLVECKSPFLKLNDEMLRQLLRYNLHFKAPLLMLSNGLEHHFWQFAEAGSPQYLRLEELPDFEGRL